MADASRAPISDRCSPWVARARAGLKRLGPSRLLVPPLVLVGPLFLAGCAGCSAPAGQDAGAPDEPTDGGGTGEDGGVEPPVDGGVEPPPAACEAAPGGGSATVAEPILQTTLSDQWHEGWLASPAAADLDGDGTTELIAARHGRVLVWHLDGSVVWSRDVDGRCWASPVVADLRADLPGLEVAQASADAIYAWGADGTPLPGFPHPWRGELRSLAAGDIDGDGALELVSVTTDGLSSGGQFDILTAVNGDGSVVAGFPPNTTGASGCDDACYVYNGYDQNVALGDVDGDGVADVFATQDNAYNSLHHGDGVAFECAAQFVGKTRFMGVRALHDTAEAAQGWASDEETALQGHHTNTAPAIADLDGDGSVELVYLASVQNAAQTQRELGVALWALHHDGTRAPGWEQPLRFPDYLSGLWDYGTSNIVAITNQVSVAELDRARPGLEIVFAGFDGRIHGVDAAQGSLFDTAYTTSDQTGTGGVVIADLSGDGVPELVFASYSTGEGEGELFVLGANGAVLHRLPLPGRGAMAVPTVDNVDDDPALEILVALKDSADGQVLVYEVPGSAANCRPWPTGRGSYLRNGSVP